MLRMDKVYVIRHKVLVEGQSGRSVARELGVSRNTVSKYLQTSESVRKPEAAPRPRPVTDKIAPRHVHLHHDCPLPSPPPPPPSLVVVPPPDGA
jgi:DNA-binding transcriptional MocR family regulator